MSFTLPGTRDQRTTGNQIDSRAARLHGLVHLSGSNLVIEWAGIAEVIEAHGPEMHRRMEPIPATRREIPVTRLAEIEVRGRWRPRLEIRGADLDALEGVPTASRGRVALRIPRGERLVARHLAVNVRSEMADQALRAAEDA